MSIERAIERIEDYFKAYVPRKQMGENVLYILKDEAKEEADPPCERCKELDVKIIELESELNNL